MLGAVLGGAFLGGLADRMKENREYVREKSDAMQEYLWKAGLERQQEVKKQQNDLTAAVDYLDSKGMDKNKINALLENDPRELLRLTQIALNAEKTTSITGAILDSAVDLTADYTSTGLSPSELIKSATVEFVEAGELPKPEKIQKNMLQKIFGATSTEEIMYDVYSSDIMGRKGADIQASISAPILKRRVGDTVKTDLSKLIALDPSDILQGQRELVDIYDDALEDKIVKLQKEANYLQQNNRSAELKEVQKRINKLEKIQDLSSAGERKERLNEMLTNPDIGFDIAQQYYIQFPQYFIGQPTFVDQNLLPYISGEETYQPTSGPSQPSSTPSSTPSSQPSSTPITYPDITIQQGQDPLDAARKFFSKKGNRGETIVDVIMPDGTRKTYIKDSSGIKEKP